jgi:hypothetical protein
LHIRDEDNGMCSQLYHKSKASILQVQQKQDWGIGLFVSHHVTVLKLMGVDDTTPFALLPANINNEDELLEVATSREQQNLKDVICFYRLLTKFWFRQYDEASCYPSRSVIRFLDVYHKFYEGLTALHLARRRSEDEQKWTISDLGRILCLELRKQEHASASRAPLS